MGRASAHPTLRSRGGMLDTTHPAAVALAASGAVGLSCTLHWDRHHHSKHSKHSQHSQGHTTQRQVLADQSMQPLNHTVIMYALYGDNVRLLLLLPDATTPLAHHDRSMSRLTQGCVGFTHNKPPTKRCWSTLQPSGGMLDITTHSCRRPRRVRCSRSQLYSALGSASAFAAFAASPRSQAHTTQRLALANPSMQPHNHTVIMYALYGDSVRLMLLLPDAATPLAHHDR